MSGNYDSEELLDGSREASSAEGSAEGEDGSVLVNSVDSPNQVLIVAFYGLVYFTSTDLVLR